MLEGQLCSFLEYMNKYLRNHEIEIPWIKLYIASFLRESKFHFFFKVTALWASGILKLLTHYTADEISDVICRWRSIWSFCLIECVFNTVLENIKNHKRKKRIMHWDSRLGLYFLDHNQYIIKSNLLFNWSFQFYEYIFFRICIFLCIGCTIIIVRSFY